MGFKMDQDEAQKKIREAISEFVFGDVDSNLRREMSKVLTSALDKMEDSIPTPANFLGPLTEKDREEFELTGKLHLRINLEVWEGVAAGTARQMGMAIPEDVPDCARIKNGQWDWIEFDYTIKMD